VSERLGDIGPEGDLHYWVNDGLMAFFFSSSGSRCAA
jgi:Na+/H+ antiporter NhaA